MLYKLVEKKEDGTRNEISFADQFIFENACRRCSFTKHGRWCCRCAFIAAEMIFNSFDCNAIEVWRGDTRVGYVSAGGTWKDLPE